MKISYKIGVNSPGLQSTVDRLVTFDKKFRRGALRKAGNAASAIVLRALKDTAPKQSGTWKRSLGRKVAVLGKGTALWFGAGPRSAYYAMVTFDPKKGRTSSQMMQRIRRAGQRDETRNRGTFKSRVRTGGTVGTLKNSRKAANGTPALFWTDRRGKVRAMALTHKRWPVLYSHLIEKGTQFTRAHRMIQRAAQASKAASEAAIQRVLSDAMGEV